MYAIQTLVGQRYGMWLKGTKRFPTHEAAQYEANSITSSERRIGATPMRRMVVKA